MAGFASDSEIRELRLFIEELCCNLVRFEHTTSNGVAPEDVCIDQEVDLGIGGAFADIRVKVPGGEPYFIEVKYAYPIEEIISHVGRKYGKESAQAAQAAKVILVINDRPAHEVSGIKERLEKRLHKGLSLEVWPEAHLLSLLRQRFGVDITSLAGQDASALRQAIDQAKGRYAFGDEFAGDSLQTTLLWHFGFWRLQQLRARKGLHPREILPPGLYRRVAVLYADLSSFSSFVRDTRDDAVVRHALTTFYSKTRYEVQNLGGMVYQFLGDGAIAIFGIPDQPERYIENAFECARAILDIGDSVSNEWQRCIDQVQSSGGAHVGMALGDLNVLSMRPFSRSHMALIGESINLAARLTGVAGSREIVVSNSFYKALPESARAGFMELEPVEAKNIGKIKSWKLA